MNDIKAIWLTAKTERLSTSVEVVKLAKKFRRQRLLKKAMVIVMAFVAALLLATVMVVYKSTLVSTRLGELLLLAACAVLATTNIRSIRRFYKPQVLSNKEFLQFLEQTRQNQISYYRKTQVVGLLLCSAGLLLYLYEFVYQNRLLLLSVYTATVAYLLFLWLFLRPRLFRKGANELKETRERLEEISDQLNAPS